MYDPIRDLPAEKPSETTNDDHGGESSTSAAAAEQAKRENSKEKNSMKRSASESVEPQSEYKGSSPKQKRARLDQPSTLQHKQNFKEHKNSREKHSPGEKRFHKQSSPGKQIRRERSASPPARSPPRQRKRPGAASRVDAVASRETLRQRQIDREAEQQKVAAERGSHDVVKQYYNSVPQRGREWRRTDSKIKNLRSFNNWVKSVLIQKFSPNEDYTPGGGGGYGRGRSQNGILVLDIGCGKGGDIGKWQKAPQRVDCYIGIDPAEVSISQAKERYEEMSRSSRQRMFEAHFFAKDGYGEWVGDIPIVRDIGIDREVGPGTSSRWSNAGFDVVTMMFCMHYAFENEEKARGMLRNVAGALKKGGRFIGVIPNSDIIRAHVEDFHAKKQKEDEVKPDGEAQESKEDGQIQDDVLRWGNELYSVRFPGDTPADGVFRPPFGWKYSYFIQEAVEAPEYLVPFEAFRALAEDYNLELQYRKPFHDIWKEEQNDRELGALSVRMGVTKSLGGEHLLTPDEWEAVGFYHAFCFYRV